MATTTIEPDSDLEQMRAWIERFKEDEEEEVRLSSLVLTRGGGGGGVGGAKLETALTKKGSRCKFIRRPVSSIG